MLEEAAGRGRVEQVLHESHTGGGIAGAGDVEDLLRARDVPHVIADSTRPSMHRLPLHFPGVGEGPAGISHSFSTSLILERRNKTGNKRGHWHPRGSQRKTKCNTVKNSFPLAPPRCN